MERFDATLISPFLCYDIAACLLYEIAVIKFLPVDALGSY